MRAEPARLLLCKYTTKLTKMCQQSTDSTEACAEQSASLKYSFKHF